MASTATDFITLPAFLYARIKFLLHFVVTLDHFFQPFAENDMRASVLDVLRLGLLDSTDGLSLLFLPSRAGAVLTTAFFRAMKEVLILCNIALDLRLINTLSRLLHFVL